MTKPEFHPQSSRSLGRAMLDAWLCGDRPRLSQNLRAVNSMPIRSADAAETDRLETLKAIAERMWLVPDLAASRAEDPRIGSWLSLLDHLASSDSFDAERGAAAISHHLTFKPGFAVHQALKQ